MSFNESIDNNILNLKIISKIEENDKLITSNNLLKIDRPTLLQGMHRWIGNESRSNAIERLSEIYDEGFKITDDLLSKEKSLKENQNELCDTNSQVFQKYIVEFTNSLNGIDNLKKTYKNDVLILSQLEMIINKVNTRLEKMNDIFKININ